MVSGAADICLTKDERISCSESLCVPPLKKHQHIVSVVQDHMICFFHVENAAGAENAADIANIARAWECGFFVTFLCLFHCGFGV
jgi:hypothetical protein